MSRLPLSLESGRIELRELRVFFTLADELHFGRSAERLGLAPSRVSQTLRTLERKLGDQLLHRTSRRVTLTPFGERFLADAMPAYQQLVDVLERARASDHDLEGTLRLGLPFLTAGGPHLTAIIEAFEERHPRCDVQLGESRFHDPLGPLLQGEVDLVATRLPVERDDIAVGPVLLRERRVLRVRRGHPLTSRDEVAAENISNGHLIPLHGYSAETMEALLPAATSTWCPARSRQLRVAPRTPFEVEALVARGVVAHVTVPSYAEYHRHPDIVHIPIRDMPPATTGLVWRCGASGPRVDEFIRMAREIVALSFTSSAT